MCKCRQSDPLASAAVAPPSVSAAAGHAVAFPTWAQLKRHPLILAAVVVVVVLMLAGRKS